MINLPLLDGANVKNKRVFVRGDIDVPLQSLDGEIKIVDDSRLNGIWPTIQYLLSQDAQVILAGHLGRPKTQEDKKLLSSRPVASWLKKKIGNFPTDDVNYGCFVENICGFTVNQQLIVLENLRFDPREENNDAHFAKLLASLADVYVNESFASDHGHASIVEVPKLLPHYAGLRFVQEVNLLDQIIQAPKKPMLVIIGGAKLETKLPVISRMANVADLVVVGGKLLEQMSDDQNLQNVRQLDLTADGKDCTLTSIDKCLQNIASYQTIVWNGPVGMVEDYTFQVGTRRIAELVAATNAYKIVGGGDTVSFLEKLGLTDKFNWVCSGGGAMLMFLAGDDLPGIQALTQ